MRRPLAWTAFASSLSLAALLACNRILGIDPDSLHERAPGAVTIQPAAIVFGGLACGQASVIKQVTLANTTGSSVDFTAVLNGGERSPFSISVGSGTIESKGQVAITVSAKPLAADGGIVSVTDTLLVTTSAVDAGASIALSGSAVGTLVVVDKTMLTFATTSPGSASDASIVVTNTGDITATIALDAGTAFTFTPPTLALPPDASATVGVQFVPARFGVTSASVKVAATEGTCKTAPIISLSGSSAGSVKQLATGNGNACVLLTNGKIVCWGYHAQLVQPPPIGGDVVPTLITGFPSNETITQISNGTLHACATMASGAAYCWGDDEEGELGDGADLDAGSPPYQRHPVRVKNLTNVAMVLAANRTSCAVVRAPSMPDEIWCWGSGANSKLGDGRQGIGVHTALPIRVAFQNGASVFPPAPVASLVGGGAVECALLVDGRAFCWGDDTAGGLGGLDAGGPVPGFPTAVTVTSSEPIATLGISHFSTSCATTMANSLYCWGNNAQGAVGNGTPGGTVPNGYEVPLTDALQVGGGFDDFCALHDGWLRCWGSNYAGQTSFAPPIGYVFNDAGITPEPKEVTSVGPNNLVRLSVGLAITCALRSTGEVLCFGANNDGELGVGFKALNRDDAGSGYTAEPTQVPGFK